MSLFLAIMSPQLIFRWFGKREAFACKESYERGYSKC